MEGMIRRAVKAWLHLPASICNGILYSRNRDGGLGIAKLESLIPSIQARRVYRLANSVDEMTRVVVRSLGADSEFWGLWASAAVALMEGELHSSPQRVGNKSLQSEIFNVQPCPSPSLPRASWLPNPSLPGSSARGRDITTVVS
ncbi:Unknown (protein for MGC:194878) [Arapaima gigas]